MSDKPNNAPDSELEMPAGHWPCPLHDRLNDRLLGIESALNEIKASLIGNPALGHQGIVVRMNAMETKVEAHDRKFLVWGAIVTAVGMAITAAKDTLK